MAYEAREAVIHDQMIRLKTARKEGINKGAAEKAVIIAKNSKIWR
ncbi:hypothetical protein [Clostridium felsineum]|nr:hypothetical protein [Clostridium felsineum]URZ18385.1 hypothetical protein CLFE_044550 [Clostridium felsineum DSM 794]